MSTITKVIPSGSTNGKPIKVVATATPGTTFHVASSTTGVLDELTMYLTNTDTVDHKVAVELGGTTNPDNHMRFVVPAGETILAVPGIPLNGGVTIGAFDLTAGNLVTMSGYINRIA